MLPEIRYCASKIFIHRWPHDTPQWSEDTRRHIEQAVNKNPRDKQVTVRADTIQIEDMVFTALKKVGVSVPFFKKECTMIFECRFGEYYAHIHITTRSPDYMDVFNRLVAWRDENFAG